MGGSHRARRRRPQRRLRGAHLAAAGVGRQAAVGVVRRLPVDRSARGHRPAGHRRRDRPEEPRRDRPVAVAAHPAGPPGEHHPSRRRRGDRAEHPDAGGRCVVRGAAARRVDGPGHVRRRRTAIAAVERCRSGRSAGDGAGRARLRRVGRADANAAARGADHGARGARWRWRGRSRRRPPRRRADEHRRAEPPGERLGPHLGRHDARHRQAPAAGRDRPGNAGADPGRRDAARRLSLPLDSADCRRPVGDRPERRRLAPAHREGRRRAGVLLAPSRRSLRLGDRRPRGPRRSRAAEEADGADRADGDRPAGAPGHAARRAHVGQRDPGAVAREPSRRLAPAPAALGARRRGAARPGVRRRSWSGRCAACIRSTRHC